MHSGVRWEGDQPEITDADSLALTAFNFLSNGMGGLDWAGLPVVVDVLGIEDVDGLMHRLYLIKTHNPPKDD